MGIVVWLNNRFTVRCLPAIYFLDKSEEASAEIYLARSPLLFWSAVAVGARESKELEETYHDARAQALALFRRTLLATAGYWDLCGAMVHHKWLAPIRPIGECHCHPLAEL